MTREKLQQIKIRSRGNKLSLAAVFHFVRPQTEGEAMSDIKTQTRDGVDRRGMLKCMGWAGTGALFTLSGGLASSVALDTALAQGINAKTAIKPLSFVQISDTHVGFSKAANPDPIATLRETIAQIKSLPQQPDFIVHTGDVTHLAKPDQFDLAHQVLSGLASQFTLFLANTILSVAMIPAHSTLVLAKIRLAMAGTASISAASTLSA